MPVAESQLFKVMGGKGKETAQRLLAIIVIIAMLAMMGIPPPVIIFFAIVVYFVWRAVERSEQQEIRGIFNFYIAANDILREEERRWYGFEIREVIERGEKLLRIMSDAPPLVHYALGALHHRAGDYEAAVEHLSYVLEDEQGDERHRHVPSPELRRYVQVLRHLEREPSEAPQTMAAIRSLERARRARAETILNSSREQLGAQAAQVAELPARAPEPHDRFAPQPEKASNNQQPFAQPPPIAEVLRNVYEEEKKTA